MIQLQVASVRRAERERESSASFRLVTPARRRLSPGQLAPRSPAAPDPGLRLSVSGKLWQVEPLSAVILPRTVVTPRRVYSHRQRWAVCSVAARSCGAGGGETFRGEWGRKVLSHPESQPRCCLNFSASVQHAAKSCWPGGEAVLCAQTDFSYRRNNQTDTGTWKHKAMLPLYCPVQLCSTSPSVAFIGSPLLSSLLHRYTE